MTRWESRLCPTCGGRGTIDTYDNGEYDEEQCPECDGSGWIYEPINDEDDSPNPETDE